MIRFRESIQLITVKCSQINKTLINMNRMMMKDNLMDLSEMKKDLPLLLEEMRIIRAQNKKIPNI